MRQKAIAILLIAGALAALALAQTNRVLVINAKVASNDVRVINGRAYAPVADIAKAFGLTISVQGDRYELVRPGGTNQIQGLQGKTGDWLFDGGWRFRVDRAYKTDAYNRVNEYYDDPVYAPAEGKELVVVEYTYRNANRDIQHFSIENPYLAGADGTAVQAFHNDFPHDGDRFFAKGLLPGAEAKGAFLFQVNPGFQFKDIVLKIGDLAGYDQAVKPSQQTVFRIALQPEN